MRTLKGVELTLTGMLTTNFKLVGEEKNKIASETAKEIIQFLSEEDNLAVPPLESSPSMKIIHKPRGGGKTTELIELASQNEGGCIVCQNMAEAKRIYSVAKDMGKNILFPVTYSEFANRTIYTKGVKELYIDNLEFFLNYLSKVGVPVRAITLNLE